ncbi:MAG: ATP-binding protein [Rhodobacteraceae bacterium]|nr:ATP-binding protein [Paracoccaceae bacterium]
MSHAASDLALPLAPKRPATSAFFYTDAHWRALDQLSDGLRDGPGVSALVGMRGCGKTSLRRIAQEQAPASVRVVAARANQSDFEPFFSLLLDALGAEAAVSSTEDPLQALYQRLAQLAQAEVGVALFIDDAHRLSLTALAQAADLTDCGRLDDGRPFGVRLVLVGDDLLLDKIVEADREPLYQAEVADVRPFLLSEIASFARTRLGRPLPDLTVERLAARSAGVPAVLSRLLQRAMAEAGEAAGGDVWLDAAGVDAAADALGFGEIDPHSLRAAADTLQSRPPGAELDPFVSADPPSVGSSASAARPTRPFTPAEEALSRAPTSEPSTALHRQRRFGPRLINRSRWRRAGVLSRLAWGGGIMIAAVVGLAMVMQTVIVPRAADQGVDLTSTTVETYENHRGVVLDVMEGAFAAAEGVARQAATLEEVGPVAADLAAEAAEARGVLRAGRTAESLQQLPAAEAAAARRAELARLFAAAERHFDAKRYTRPSGANAYAVLLAAYRLEPRSESAGRGFARLIAVYRGLARAALEKSDFDSYYRYNELVDRIEARESI